MQIAPYYMWCPIYVRALTAAGFHMFPINSIMKGPNMDYAYGPGRPNDPQKVKEQAAQFVKKCDYIGNVHASMAGDCWMEYKMASINVPIHNFEYTLLEAMAAIGINIKHKGAAFYRLHGVPDEELIDSGNLDPLYHRDPTYYNTSSWHICPPKTTQCVLQDGSKTAPV